MGKRRNSYGFLEILLGIKEIRKFAVKLCKIIVFGVSLNLIRNEVVCYAIIFCVVLALFKKFLMEVCKNEG